MGTQLPVISAKKAIRAFERLGFTVLAGRGKGSHIALWKDGLGRPVIVPNHDPLDRGTLNAILKQAGVSREEFVAQL